MQKYDKILKSVRRRRMEEVNEALDKIISINHKIVSFLIEIAKMENEGKAIDEKFILENNILTTLFEQEQEQYRKIYSEININKAMRKIRILVIFKQL